MPTESAAVLAWVLALGLVAEVVASELIDLVSVFEEVVLVRSGVVLICDLECFE